MIQLTKEISFENQMALAAKRTMKQLELLMKISRALEYGMPPTSDFIRN
jgi:lysyl-tRNA synthetase class II